jgi:hypothetical protein
MLESTPNINLQGPNPSEELEYEMHMKGQKNELYTHLRWEYAVHGHRCNKTVRDCTFGVGGPTHNLVLLVPTRYTIEQSTLKWRTQTTLLRWLVSGGVPQRCSVHQRPGDGADGLCQNEGLSQHEAQRARGCSARWGSQVGSENGWYLENNQWVLGGNHTMPHLEQPEPLKTKELRAL